MLFVIVLLSIVYVVILHRAARYDKERFNATNDWCNAGEAFTNWRLRNPGVYIGLSEEGRKLLGRNLETYDEFCRAHPCIDGKEHREWLMSLFYDFPPKSPDDMPTEYKTKIELVA